MKEDKTYHPASHLQLHTSVCVRPQSDEEGECACAHILFTSIYSFIYKSKTLLKIYDESLNGKKSKSMNNVYLQIKFI